MTRELENFIKIIDNRQSIVLLIMSHLAADFGCLGSSPANLEKGLKAESTFKVDFPLVNFFRTKGLFSRLILILHININVF